VNAATKRPIDNPPGGLLVWLVVTLELLTFSVVFVLLALFRTGQPELFGAEQAALDVDAGLVLTLVLVTSGALAAGGVHAFRREQLGRARALFLTAGATGIGFVGLKLFDYVAHADAGHGLGTNDFWDAYVLATGFHLAHVLVGVGLLLVVGWKIGRAQFEDAETAVAGSALFWHMCDVAWFFLFPLFYAPLSP